MDKMLLRMLETLITPLVDMATTGKMMTMMSPESLGQKNYLLGKFLWVKNSFLINFLKTIIQLRSKI